MTNGEKKEAGVWVASAWGQLIVGSLLGGMSLWKLALAAGHLNTSRVLESFGHDYDTLRDILASPFVWFHLALSNQEKSALLISLVLLAASSRSLYRIGKDRIDRDVFLMWFGFSVLVGWSVYVFEGARRGFVFFDRVLSPQYGLHDWAMFVLFYTVVLGLIVRARMLTLSQISRTAKKLSTFVALNIRMTIVLAVTLLLVNTAMM